MFCKACGKKIDDDSIFCSFCGTKLSAEYKSLVVAHDSPSGGPNSSISPATNKSSTNKTQPKYDPSYEKESDAVTVGIILLLISLGFAIFRPDEISEGFLALTSIVFFIGRVLIIIWVANIANRQNRHPLGWGFFAFFLPSIALIVMGAMKKKYAGIDLVEGIDNEQNSALLTDKAKDFFDDDRLSDSIRFAEKAIELFPGNTVAKELLKKSKLAFSENDNLNKGIQTVYRELSDGRLLKIVSIRSKTIGAKVFIDDLPASDGLYTYKSGNRKLIIADGAIAKMYFIDKVKNLVIEKSVQFEPAKGDKVFLSSGEPAPTGTYSLGFMAGHVKVKDGMFEKFEGNALFRTSW